MRARLIKPGFYKSDTLAELPMAARILFSGLWCLADRDGRLKDRPRVIKIEVLPYDDCDVDALLSDLAAAGFIIRYQAAGERYIQVVSFAKHQSPNVREPASTIPAPCEHSASPIQDTPVPVTVTVTVPEAVAVAVTVPDARAREDDTPPATSDEAAVPDEPPRKPPRYSQDFDRLWRRYPAAGREDKPGAFAEYRRQQPNGDDLDAGLTRWEASRRWRDGYVVPLKRWLKERRWEDEPEPATGSARASPNGHGKPSKLDIIRTGLGVTDDRGSVDAGLGAVAGALAAPGRQPGDGRGPAPGLP